MQGQGGGFFSLFYALKGFMSTFVVLIVTSVAVLSFMWLIVRYIWAKNEGKDTKDMRNQILMGLFILFVIFSLYGIISILGEIFGLTNAPIGGLKLI